MDVKMIERLAQCVYDLVENSYDFAEDGIGYGDACDLIGLTEEEETAVLDFIDADLRLC